MTMVTSITAVLQGRRPHHSSTMCSDRETLLPSEEGNQFLLLSKQEKLFDSLRA